MPSKQREKSSAAIARPLNHEGPIHGCWLFTSTNRMIPIADYPVHLQMAHAQKMAEGP